MPSANFLLFEKRHLARLGTAAVAVAVALTLSAAAGITQPLAVDPDSTLAPVDSDSSESLQRVPEQVRSDLLGEGWSAGSDVAISTVGDALGFSILKSTSADGYEWSSIARLSVAGVEADRWVGNTCRTQDGKFLVAVFGPRTFANDEQLFREGGFAAIVDIGTGTVDYLGRGYSLAYFNPGCGTGNQVALSKFDGEVTSIGVLDASTGQALRTVNVRGQVTSPTIGPGGRIYAASMDSLVSVGQGGAVKTIAKTTSPGYSLTFDKNGGLSYLSYSGQVATRILR